MNYSEGFTKLLPSVVTIVGYIASAIFLSMALKQLPLGTTYAVWTGIGSVWLGTWPQMERVQAQTELFHLPENQIPHSIIAFGHPDETPAVKAPEWEEDRVHYEKW